MHFKRSPVLSAFSSGSLSRAEAEQLQEGPEFAGFTPEHIDCCLAGYNAPLPFGNVWGTVLGGIQLDSLKAMHF